MRRPAHAQASADATSDADLPGAEVADGILALLPYTLHNPLSLVVVRRGRRVQTRGDHPRQTVGEDQRTSRIVEGQENRCLARSV